MSYDLGISPECAPMSQHFAAWSTSIATAARASEYADKAG